MNANPNPITPALEPLVAELPELMVARRIMWTNDRRNPLRPLHSRVFTEYLLGAMRAFGSLHFVIEGSPPGSPFAQLARADDRYLVDSNRTGEHEMWTVGRVSEVASTLEQLHAPWLSCGSVPAFTRNILGRGEAADVIWAWMSSVRWPDGMVGEPCIMGPHRQVS